MDAEKRWEIQEGKLKPKGIKMEMDLKQLLSNIGLSKNDFQDSVVVITGSGRGIGLQVARAFALLGSQVVIAELTDEGEKTEQLIRSEGGKALFVQADVADSQSVAHLVQVTHERFGPAQILVNNAIRCPVALVAEMDENLWDQVMSVNLRGTFLTCKAFLPDMITHKKGTIINMISADAMPGLSAYIASKQGIVGFSQSLDLEVEAHNIQVVPFGPGMVDTPSIRAIAPTLAPLLGMTEAQFLTTPLHAAYDGLMPPEHAGAATVYLAAKLAKEYHGQVINGYEVLEKAGLLKSPLTETVETKAAPVKSMHGDTLTMIKQLEASLVDTEKEFNKLPGFIRPMARNGFKTKAGQSLADWQRSISKLRSEIETGESPSQTTLPALLGKLIIYFRDVPKETSRFTKDADFLRQVSETSNQRVAVIEILIQNLK
jgi:NAD(P)-dependent dehydrogenase (short-subunit alcohol dehydrogenase family)